MIDRLPDGDYYDSADELIAEDDIIETDVKIAGWNKKFRVRALTFKQMEIINRNATAKKDDEEKGITAGELINEEWVYWTLVYGIVRPVFKIEKARRLGDSNGEFVKALADEIWNLGRVSKPLWNAYIAEIRAANNLAEDKIDEATKELNKIQ